MLYHAVIAKAQNAIHNLKFQKRLFEKATLLLIRVSFPENVLTPICERINVGP